MARHDPRSSSRTSRINATLCDRRTLIASALGAAASGVFATCAKQADAAEDSGDWKVVRDRVHQSVVHWCFQPMDVETLARAAAAMGVKSVEIVEPAHWPILKKHGLTCAIAPSHGFVRGLNRVEHHDECLEKLRAAINASADFGCPNVITFSGMRAGISDEEGIRNTVAGVKKIIAHAEKQKVNLCFEVLNSRVNVEMKGHPDYQADTIEWGVEVCKQVGSERMKLLFDIYHVQIMQGDIITRIRQYKDYISHYHTAGNPGRNEIDASQEINYPAIMQAIVDTGYRGFVGQEFIPTRADKIAALRDAVKLCDI